MKQLTTTILALLSITFIAIALNMWSQIAALIWLGVVFGLIALNEAVVK